MFNFIPVLEREINEEKGNQRQRRRESGEDVAEKNRQQRQSFNRRDLRISSLRSDTLFQELTPALPPCPPRLSLHMQFARAPPCRDSRSPPAWSGPPSWLTPPRPPPLPSSSVTPCRFPAPPRPLGIRPPAPRPAGAPSAPSTPTLLPSTRLRRGRRPRAPSVRSPRPGCWRRADLRHRGRRTARGWITLARAVRRRSEPGCVSICALVPQDYEKPQLLGLQRQTRDICGIYPNDSDNV